MMMGFVTGSNLADEAMSLAASIVSARRITFDNFPDQEAIREHAIQEGYEQSNDGDFLENVAKEIEFLTGIRQ